MAEGTSEQHEDESDDVEPDTGEQLPDEPANEAEPAPDSSSEQVSDTPSVNYHLTLEDHRVIRNHTMATTRRTIGLWRAVVPLIIGGFLAGIAFGQSNANFDLWAGIAIFIVATSGVVYLLVQERLLADAFNRQRLRVDPGGTVTLLFEGLRQDTPVRSIVFPWATIGNVNEYRRYVFIEIGPGQLIAIPNAAFGTEARRGHFVAEVQRRMEAA